MYPRFPYSRAIALVSFISVFFIGGCSSGNDQDGNAPTGPVFPPLPVSDKFIGDLSLNLADLQLVEEPFDFSLTNFDPQLLVIARDDERQIACTAELELITLDIGIDLWYSQYLSNHTSLSVISESDRLLEEVVTAKQVIFQSEQSDGLDVTGISDLYYLSKSITSYGITTVLIIECRTATIRFSENEVKMRRILNSLDLLRESDEPVAQDFSTRLWLDYFGLEEQAS